MNLESLVSKSGLLKSALPALLFFTDPTVMGGADAVQQFMGNVVFPLSSALAGRLRVYACDARDHRAYGLALTYYDVRRLGGAVMVLHSPSIKTFEAKHFDCCTRQDGEETVLWELVEDFLVSASQKMGISVLPDVETTHHAQPEL